MLFERWKNRHELFDEAESDTKRAEMCVVYKEETVNGKKIYVFGY